MDANTYFREKWKICDSVAENCKACPISADAPCFAREYDEPDKIIGEVEKLARNSGYLVNVVFSDGLYNGRESIPVFGQNRLSVITRAYGIYCEECDSDMGFDEFRKILDLGFNGGDDIVLIQKDDYHVQFEATEVSL